MVSSARPEQQAALLRAVAEHLGLPPVKRLIRAPGVTAVIRVTAYYHDRRALDSVATLWHSRVEGNKLAISYRGAFGQKPILHPISDNRYEALAAALSQLHFNHLHDQPTMPLHGLDFWMVERATGGFLRSVILAPDTAQAEHARLLEIIRDYLPEALRLVSRN